MLLDAGAWAAGVDAVAVSAALADATATTLALTTALDLAAALLVGAFLEVDPDFAVARGLGLAASLGGAFLLMLLLEARPGTGFRRLDRTDFIGAAPPELVNKGAKK